MDNRADLKEFWAVRGSVSIHLCNRYAFNVQLLNSHYKPGIIVGTGIIIVNKTDKNC